MLYDTNSTVIPTSTKTLITIVLGSSDTLSIDLTNYGLTLQRGETLTITNQRSANGNIVFSNCLTWNEDI